MTSLFPLYTGAEINYSWLGICAAISINILGRLARKIQIDKQAHKHI